MDHYRHTKTNWGGRLELVTSRLRCSLLIPTYTENENLLLVKSLEENFSGLNLEVIFIDDNSPDGTAKNLKEFAGIYNNMKLLVRLYKMGLGSAYKDEFKATPPRSFYECINVFCTSLFA